MHHRKSDAMRNGNVLLSCLKYLAAKKDPTGIEIMPGVIKQSPIKPYLFLINTIFRFAVVKIFFFFFGTFLCLAHQFDIAEPRK